MRQVLNYSTNSALFTGGQKNIQVFRSSSRCVPHGRPCNVCFSSGLQAFRRIDLSFLGGEKMLRNKMRRARRGTSAVQWVVFAAVVTLVIFASVQFMGTETNDRMEETSGGVGDPSNLVQMID